MGSRKRVNPYPYEDEPRRLDMRLLVCGGRDVHDRRKVWDEIERFTKRGVPDIVITGDCRGVDRWARDWAKTNCVPLMVFYADWEFQGKRAGPFRNGRMIIEGRPTHVLALWGGKGTANLVARAREHGVPVEEKLTQSAITAAKIREARAEGA